MERHLVEVWDRQGQLAPLARLVLSALAYAADDSGYVTASNQELAVRTGLSERQVQREVGRLVNTGDLLLVSPGGRWHGDRRRLLLACALPPDAAPLTWTLPIATRTTTVSHPTFVIASD